MKSNLGVGVIIPRWIIDLPDLHPSAQMTWVRLKAWYAHTSLDPTRSELAADLKISVDSLTRHLRALEAAGTLRLHDSGRIDLCEAEPLPSLALVRPTESGSPISTGAGVRTPFENTLSTLSTLSTPLSTAAITPGTRRTRRDELPPRFAAWWDAYPRKRAQKAALAWWLRHHVETDSALHHRITTGLAAWRAVWDAEQTAPTYVPYPRTWLNRGDYTDDLSARAQPVLSRQTAGLVAASHRFMARHGGAK